MPTVKVLKETVRSIPEISTAVNAYMITGSMKIIPNDGDYTILEAFGIDSNILKLYNQVKDSTIENAEGVVEVDIAILDEVWEGEKLVKDMFATKIKDSKALIYTGNKVGDSHSPCSDALLRKMVDRFGVEGFYLTLDTSSRKIWGYDVDKAEVLSMLKADLETWMIERGIDKLMSTFSTATKTKLQTFVIEYYYL